MNVAVFFRDKRVQAALTGPRPKQADALVDEFFSKFDYADCSASQLLALADLSTRCGNTDVAQQALLRVIESGSKQHLAHYKLGRILLGQSRHADASVQFGLGIQCDPEFPHNHMGSARALHTQGFKIEAAASAETFLTFGVRPHNKDDLTVLGDLADFLFDAGQRGRALPIYRTLHGLGVENPRHAVRIAEAKISAGEVAEAEALLLAQTARTGPDAWANRALAVCASQKGDHETAIKLALRAVKSDPASQGFIGTLVQVLGKSGDAAAIRLTMAQQGPLFTATDITELSVRLALIEDDVETASAILLATQIIPETRLFHLGFETAYAAMTSGDTDIAATLCAMMQRLAPDAPRVKILQIDNCFRQLMWEEAGALLAQIPDSDGQQPQIAMKRLEYACFTGDSATAAAAALRLEKLAETTGAHMMPPVFRYLAEKQDWSGVVDRAIGWLDATLNYRQIGLVLFRAAKYSSRQADMLAAIHDIPAWHLAEGLLTLRNNLAYDSANTVADLTALAQDPAVAGNAALVRKIAVRRDVLARAGQSEQRHAVFLCTDSNYLCATIVALHGITCAVDTRHTDFFLVVDDDVAALARASTRAFQDAGIKLTIVAASEIIDDAQKLSPEYGLFTSGHRLSSAAYYRIYFAQYLSRLGLHDRALYADGDILLNAPLDPLFRADLGGKPLAGRVEASRPDVRRAIQHHGFAPGRYFNSGIMLFDLKHPGLNAALASAISAIADEKITLIYHDQCALNLGFREGFADLDLAWNTPVREVTKLADIPPDAAILHFLDRPKPWSAAYNGEAGPLWFEKWQATAAFIGEAAALALFRQIAD